MLVLHISLLRKCRTYIFCGTGKIFFLSFCVKEQRAYPEVPGLCSWLPPLSRLQPLTRSVMPLARSVMPLANCSVHSAAVEGSLAVLLVLECGLGLVGNAIALWTFCFRLKVWKPYAVYLFNLVIADLLLTLCLPFHAASYLTHKTWSLGLSACQTLIFLRALSRGVGVAFLTAVALDRYLRVVHPRLKVNLLSLRAAWGISVLVWLLMAALSHQSLFISEAACPTFEPQGDFSFSVIWQKVLFLLQIILPFGLILFCNARIIRILQKRLRDPDKQPKLQRAQALVAVVVVLFALCFLPSFVARILLTIFRRSDSCRVRRALEHLSDVTSSLTYLQSVLNPVVYCFSNPTFRLSYRKVFYTLRGRGQEAEATGCNLKDSYS
ncbi:12-(S)-hydroxy-5,8,10,14-eicosatetraenoic acid receptor [Equus przewalskii]|uniref:12-(S)-hydroxy-5,8,10,14-eicosatetraenoic acid receptor n=1 Tax=Equus przewalskii TaxID=9798 RepID=A0ABM4N3C0_EQUPR|nr:PREDICTED: 12-(S)-hydroxy-5,8,10,14-eicosatetraenoic acid receptor [Equus przewalskii]